LKTQILVNSLCFLYLNYFFYSIMIWKKLFLLTTIICGRINIYQLWTLNVFLLCQYVIYGPVRIILTEDRENKQNSDNMLYMDLLGLYWPRTSDFVLGQYNPNRSWGQYIVLGQYNPNRSIYNIFFCMEIDKRKEKRTSRT
jgi:hypothetical protein